MAPAQTPTNVFSLSPGAGLDDLFGGMIMPGSAAARLSVRSHKTPSSTLAVITEGCQGCFADAGTPNARPPAVPNFSADFAVLPSEVEVSGFMVCCRSCLCALSMFSRRVPTATEPRGQKFVRVLIASFSNI